MKEEVEEDEEIVAEDGEEEEFSDVEEDEVEEDVDSIIDEDVEALLSGEEELSEEFREKAKLVFEVALHAKTKEIQSVLEKHYVDVLRKRLKRLN
jgi:ribosome-binding protein aMBF1 (putative translation factor)